MDRIISITTYYLHLYESLITLALADGFSLEFVSNKSSQVSKTLLSILADLNNAVVWMVSTRPVISKFSILVIILWWLYHENLLQLVLLSLSYFTAFFNSLARLTFCLRSSRGPRFFHRLIFLQRISNRLTQRGCWSVSDLTVLQSWFLREGNVILFSDMILLMVSALVFSSWVSVFVCVFAIYESLSCSVWFGVYSFPVIIALVTVVGVCWCVCLYICC